MIATQIGRRLPARIFAASLALILGAGGAAEAAPQQFDCLLTDTEAKPQSENRLLTVEFDEDSKVANAKAGDRSYSFTAPTITYISVSGQVDDVSFGIDRSSFGIVWQHYAADKVTTEFGHCRPAASAVK
jgi:hypothetical protein